MAKPDDEASTPSRISLPPGYRDLADLVQEHGRDRVKANLVSGQWRAFKFDLNTGDLELVPVEVWFARDGRIWLDGHSRWFKIGLYPFPFKHAAIIVRAEQSDAVGGHKGERLARELMDAVFPREEWRQMGPMAVCKGCEQEARARGVKLPGVDSFARAMGRRKKIIKTR